MPMSQVDFSLVTNFIAICVQDTEDLLEGASLLLNEVRERVSRGEGPLPEGIPRVLLAPGPSTSDPTVIRLMEELGIGIALCEFQAFLPTGGPVPDLGDQHDLATADPFELIARLVALVGGYNEIGPRIYCIEKAVELWDVDGILWWYPATCRPAGDAPFIKDALEKSTGLPVGLIEGDLYDPRNYNLEQQRTRLETFAEMVKISKLKRDKEKAGRN